MYYMRRESGKEKGDNVSDSNFIILPLQGENSIGNRVSTDMLPLQGHFQFPNLKSQISKSHNPKSRVNSLFTFHLSLSPFT